MEAIKQFVNTSTTSSLVERKALFEQLFEVLNNIAKHEIPELALKVVAKLLYYNFPIYIDKQSKMNLIKLNDLLIRANLEITLKTLINSLEAHASEFVAARP